MACRAVSVLDEAGCPARLVGALVDVTERKERELARQQDALRDPRTGLATRALFEDRLGAALARTRRNATYDAAVALVRLLPGTEPLPTGRVAGAFTAPVALGALVQRDVEHRTARPGDAHLALAHALARELREGDTSARVSEDDFAVLLDDTQPTGVPVRVRQLLDALRAELGPRMVVGLVEGVRGLRDVGEVLREADIAVRRSQARDEADRRPLVR
ncbi:GGDEF domain-containing protein [Cellulomonas soli]